MAETMKQRGASPVCVGVKSINDTPVNLPDVPEHLRDNHERLQFMCLGYSIYEQGKAGSGDGKGTASGLQKLPYCEGIEVIRVEVVPDGPKNQESSSHERPRYSQSTPAAPGSTSRRDESSAPPPIDWQDFAHRYVDSAQRTLHRMELTWKHMYTSAIKPLVDKVLGKDDGHT
jgi:hypothetical protein